MTRINTNVESMRGLRYVQRANSLLNMSLTRLSTGLKINSGKDNPSGLIASEALRLQVTTIEQSIKNSNRANNVIATADSALGEIGGLLTQIRGLVQEGLNNGALSQDEIEANQLQIDAALSAINRISSNTTFAGDKLIDGSKAFTTAVSAADAAKLSDFQINEALFGSSSTIAVNATVNAAATKGTLQYTGGDLTAAATIEVGGAKGSQVLFLGGDSTATNIRDAINAVKDATGVEASLATSGTSAQASLDFTTVDAVTAVASSRVFTATGGTGGELTVTADTPGAAGDNFTIEFVAGSGNNVATSAAIVGNAITVTLGTDGTGALDATKADLTTVSGVIDGIAGVSSSVTTAGTGTFGAGHIAAGPLNLTGGVDAVTQQDITFTAVNAGSEGNNITVQFVAGNNGDPTSVTVNDSDPNDVQITFTLAADGFGITETTTGLVNFLNNNTSAGAVAARQYITASGSGSDAIGNLANNALTGGSSATSTLTLTSTEYGSDQFVSVNVLSGSFATTLDDGTTAAGRDAGTDIDVTINGQAAQTRGLRAAVKTASLDAMMSFTAASNVLGATATINITGGGSIFQIGQEASVAGQIGVGIDAINTARLGGISGKLYELGSGGGKSLLDLGPDVQGSELVSIVEEALNRVSTLRGRLGALQKNVIETNVTTLGVALENISEARSQIIDTDFAEETANMTKAQVLSQASMSVLAIANQNPQQVLSLLR